MFFDERSFQCSWSMTFIYSVTQPWCFQGYVYIIWSLILWYIVDQLLLNFSQWTNSNGGRLLLAWDEYYSASRYFQDKVTRGKMCTSDFKNSYICLTSLDQTAPGINLKSSQPIRLIIWEGNSKTYFVSKQLTEKDRNLTATKYDLKGL